MNATGATSTEEDNRQRGKGNADVALSRQARESTQKAEISWKNWWRWYVQKAIKISCICQKSEKNSET